MAEKVLSIQVESFHKCIVVPCLEKSIYIKSIQKNTLLLYRLELNNSLIILIGLAKYSLARCQVSLSCSY